MIALIWCRHCPAKATTHADYEAQGHEWGKPCPAEPERMRSLWTVSQAQRRRDHPGPMTCIPVALQPNVLDIPLGFEKCAHEAAPHPPGVPMEHTYRLTLNVPEDVAAAMAGEAHRLHTTVQTVAQGWLWAGLISTRIIEVGAREN